MAVLSLPDNDAFASEKEKEKARLEQELEAKSLTELMALQRTMEKQAEEKAVVLHAVQQGDLSALKPYLQPDSKPEFIKIRDEDVERRHELISREHLRNESFVGAVQENGKDSVEKALAARKRRMKELFPNTSTDAILVHSTSGEALIEIIGVSYEEKNAAVRLEREQKEAANKSQAAKAAIQHKISEPSQQASSSSTEHETVALAHTPNQTQKDAAPRSRTSPF
jgi:hypothetical protein